MISVSIHIHRIVFCLFYIDISLHISLINGDEGKKSVYNTHKVDYAMSLNICMDKENH